MRRSIVPRAIVLLGLTVVVGLFSGCNAHRSAALTATPTTTPGVTISTETSPDGRILATGSGYTLYDFAPDSSSSSSCVTKICVELWPPLIATGTPVLGKGLKQSLVGTIKRPDGSLQITYGGHPLYTWKGDDHPGTITGQALLNAGGYWYVVAPSGQQINSAFTVTG